VDEIRRRDFMKFAAGALLVPSSFARNSLFQDRPMESHPAWKNYKRAIVVDALGGPGSEVPGDDGTAPLSPQMIADIKNSGVTVVNWTVGVVGNVPNAFEETFRSIAKAERKINAHPEALIKITKPEHISAAKSTGRLGVIYGFQDASMLGTDLSRADVFYDFGVRVIQLTYNVRNLVGDGCLEPADAGLSKFGYAVVERLNSLGVLIDLSHCGQHTTADAIKSSNKPVAVTHSGCRALADLPRNKRDEELRAVADKGGFFGIYLMPSFLSISWQVTSVDVIRHLEHAINICGEDHIGIGTDGYISATNVTPAYQKHFREEIATRRRLGISAPGERDTVYKFVSDLNTPRRFEIIANLLLARGHKESRIEKILGGNFVRIAREAWQ
jgi:membrane dipeptidase